MRQGDYLLGEWGAARRGIGQDAGYFEIGYRESGVDNKLVAGATKSSDNLPNCELGRHTCARDPTGRFIEMILDLAGKLIERIDAGAESRE
jgi:hypothetical protein